MGRFKFGFSLGTVLGAGLFWLNATEKGRKKRDELLDHAAVVYEQVKEKIEQSKAWKDMSQNEYATLVKEMVDTYAVKTGLAGQVKHMVEKVVRMQWKSIVHQLTAEEKLTK